MSELFIVAAYFLPCFLVSALVGLAFAHACSRLTRESSRFTKAAIDSVAFAAGSISGSIIVFYFLLRIFRDGGYPGVVGAILLLSALLQSLTNLGLNIWTSMPSNNRPNWKLKVVLLVASSFIAMAAGTLLK